MKRYFREWSVFGAFLAILLLLAFRAPEFFKPAQLLSMLCDAVPVLIAACGMTLVIICRQIDISNARNSRSTMSLKDSRRCTEPNFLAVPGKAEHSA